MIICLSYNYLMGMRYKYNLIYNITTPIIVSDYYYYYYYYSRNANNYSRRRHQKIYRNSQ